MLMSTGHHGARTGQTGRPHRKERTHPAAALGTRADQALGMPGCLSVAGAKAAATWCRQSIFRLIRSMQPLGRTESKLAPFACVSWVH